MAYKKIFDRAAFNTFPTQQMVKDHMYKTISEMTLAGCPQTTDTGQIAIESIPAITYGTSSANLYVQYGFFTFRIFNNAILKMEYIWWSGGNGSGALFIKPSVGAATDGAGQFVGNSVSFRHNGPQPGTNLSPNNETFDSTANYVLVPNRVGSLIYKSDRTFWLSLDMDRNFSSSRAPTISIMICKSCNSQLVPNDNYVSVFSQEYNGLTVVSGWDTVSTKAYSTTELNTSDLKISYFNPYPSNVYFDNKFNLFWVRNYHPMMNGTMDTNFDLVTGMPGYSIHLGEFPIKNGGSSKRMFKLFANDTYAPRPFKTDSNTRPIALPWD